MGPSWGKVLGTSQGHTELGSDMDLLPTAKSFILWLFEPQGASAQYSAPAHFIPGHQTVDLGPEYSKPALHALSSLCNYLIPGVCRGLISLFFRKHTWQLWSEQRHGSPQPTLPLGHCLWGSVRTWNLGFGNPTSLGWSPVKTHRKFPPRVYGCVPLTQPATGGYCPAYDIISHC